MATLEEIYFPIRKELSLTERSLAKSLVFDTLPEIQKAHSLLVCSPGKRLRPALIHLFGGALSSGPHRGKLLTDTACAFELIHMATLVHDDVMDSSHVRHRKPTINAAYGNNVAICSGDYLFAKALQALSRIGNFRLLSLAATSIQEVCEGQVLQIWKRNEWNLSLKDYSLIIRKKTAALFSASCSAASIALGKEERRLALFGHHFGMAFQMVDDYLDLMSTQAKLGKTPGENVRAGELTLPMILLRDELSSSSYQRLLEDISRSKDIASLRQLVAQHRIDLKVREKIDAHLSLARKSLSFLPPSPYRHSLALLTNLVSERMGMV